VALIGLAASGPAAGDAETVFAHEALALTRKIGYRCLEGQALTTLAGIHLARDQPEQAIEHSRHALAIDRETGQRLHQAQTLLLLGLARRLTEGADAAVPHWREAFTLLTEAGSPDAGRVRWLLQQPAGPGRVTTELPTA
jgi:tetratricopeptide (TPR) repeat protein